MKLAALACLVLLCGCASAPGQPTSPTSPTSDVVGPVRIDAPATVAPAAWHAVAFSATGHGGDGVFVYQPLPDASSGAFHFSLDQQSGAAPAYVWGPAYVFPATPSLLGGAPLFDAGAIEWSAAKVTQGKVGDDSCDCSPLPTAIVFAFASAAPWNVTLELRLGAGVADRPQTLVGLNATFLGPGVSDGTPGPAEGRTLAGPVAGSGWDLVQFEMQQSVADEGFRQYKVDSPGWTCTLTQATASIGTPASAGLRYLFGDLHASSGTLSAAYTHADTFQIERLVAVHLAFPPGFTNPKELPSHFAPVHAFPPDGTGACPA